MGAPLDPTTTSIAEVNLTFSEFKALLQLVHYDAIAILKHSSELPGEWATREVNVLSC